MKQYNIVIGSPIDYEQLTADIVINNQYIARLQMEKGKDKMILEFFEEAISQKIDAFLFLEAVAKARDLLLQ